MATTAFGFQTITGANTYAFDSLINASLQSVDDKLPHRFVASLSALDALSSAPSGQIAILTVADSGLNTGAAFVRASSQWRFLAGGASDLSVFTAALTTTIRTAPGAVIYDTATSAGYVFTNTSGSNALITAETTTWTNITHTSGVGNPGGIAPFGYRPVPGGILLRGGVQKSSGVFNPGATLGAIPTAARPNYTVRYVTSGTGNATGTIAIAPGGAMTLFGRLGSASGFYLLDGIIIPKN